METCSWNPCLWTCSCEPCLVFRTLLARLFPGTLLGNPVPANLFLETFPCNLFLETCSWALLGNCSWNPGNRLWEPYLETASWQPNLAWEHLLGYLLGNLFLGTLLGNLFLGTLLGNLFLGDLLGNQLAGNLAWEPLPGNTCWRPVLEPCFVWKNTFLEILLGNPFFETLIGNVCWNSFLETFSWKPLLKLISETWEPVPGNLALEPLHANPCLGTCSWEPCLETASWEPGDLAQWHFGCSDLLRGLCCGWRPQAYAVGEKLHTLAYNLWPGSSLMSLPFAAGNQNIARWNAGEWKSKNPLLLPCFPIRALDEIECATQPFKASFKKKSRTLRSCDHGSAAPITTGFHIEVRLPVALASQHPSQSRSGASHRVLRHGGDSTPSAWHWKKGGRVPLNISDWSFLRRALTGPTLTIIKIFQCGQLTRWWERLR